MMTVGTLYPLESMLQSAVLEVINNFLLYMQRQGLALRRHFIPERRVVSLNDLV